MTSLLTSSGIYAIVHKDSNKRYVGSACCFYRRWSVHRWGLRHNKHYNLHLQHAWNLYGEGTFSFQILIVLEKQELLKVEQFFLDSGPSNMLYNHRPTAGSFLGQRHTEATLAKMRGRPVSAETRLKLSQARLGRTVPEAALVNMRKAQRGRKVSEEVAARLRTLAVGRRCSEQAREKNRLAHLGTKHSDESKAKMRAAKARRRLKKLEQQ